MSMTGRERYRRILAGEPTDRMPYCFGWPRESTFRAWARQGLLPQQRQRWGEFIGVDPWNHLGMLYDGPIPPFEERVLEQKGNKRVWVDHWGVKRIDAVRQPTEGFAPRRYLEFPVKTPADFEEMKRRFDPHSPERFVPDPAQAEATCLNPDGYRRYPARADCWRDRVALCNEGEWPVRANVAGLFWRCRDWAGLEELALMFRLQPALVHEMMEFWTWFLMEMLDEPLSRIAVDEFVLNEDMAYKTASLISPADMRRFMLPRYRRLYAFLKERGVRCVVMDSDGHLSQVLDVFHPETIDGAAPVEIAAGNNPAAHLARYPRLYLNGGIDKRQLRADKRRVRAEVARRYGAARRFGRYLPAVDHGVPPDVPLRSFLYMVELIKGFAGGEDLATYEPPGELEALLGPAEEAFDADQAIREAYGG
jgi:uroporphyrinogen decarboxylase